VGRTAASGDYRFQQADLGVFRGIAGLLSSSGKFSVLLNRIVVKEAKTIRRRSCRTGLPALVLPLHSVLAMEGVLATNRKPATPTHRVKRTMRMFIERTPYYE
jgi:hypothetical protein